jgi:hypothetical protein
MVSLGAASQCPVVQHSLADPCDVVLCGGFIPIGPPAPKITMLAGNEFLVDYLAGKHKLGYFVGTLVDDKIVIRTFLFLTMQGTPEARQLRQKLAMARPDIEYTKLDQLSTLLESDIATDPDLRRLLGDCGCGCLLDLANNQLRDRLKQGYAAQLKRYLRLSNNPGVKRRRSCTPSRRPARRRASSRGVTSATCWSGCRVTRSSGWGSCCPTRGRERSAARRRRPRRVPGMR